MPTLFLLICGARKYPAAIAPSPMMINFFMFFFFVVGYTAGVFASL